MCAFWQQQWPQGGWAQIAPHPPNFCKWPMFMYLLQHLGLIWGQHPFKPPTSAPHLTWVDSDKCEVQISKSPVSTHTISMKAPDMTLECAT